MPGLLGLLLITHAPHHHPHRTYADMAGEEVFKKYQTLIYLAGSASAEVFADIALCPFEAVKVSMGRASLFGWGRAAWGKHGAVGEGKQHGESMGLLGWGEAARVRPT